MTERCAVCGCQLHRTNDTYARPTPAGRSHATKHHFVAQRFFGSSGVFEACPWGYEGRSTVFCYECHEELLHNPVLLPEDVSLLAELVRLRGLSEDSKPDDRSRIAGRVALLHETIARGLAALLAEARARASNTART